VNFQFDVIIIGSGLGGLTCGAFLAKAGMKVLVLEQHSQIGGYAHSFKRKQFTFESGIHSVSLDANGMIMRLLSKLGIQNQIEPIAQDSMFRFQIPGFEYTVPAQKQVLLDKLYADFPAEKEGIDKLFASMQEIYDHMIKPMFTAEEKVLEEDREFAAQYFGVSYRDFLASHVSDPKLRSIFEAQWPYGGISPDKAPTIFFAMMFYVHFLEGSHYCTGGFHSLAMALASVIERTGGQIRMRSRVKRIECNGDAVKAVYLDNDETFSSRIVVSNISPYTLHRQIIDEPARNKIWLRRLNRLMPSASAVTVYLGLTRPASDFTNTAINFWFNDTFENVYSNGAEGKLDKNDQLVVLRSAVPDTRVLQLLYFTTMSASDKWKEMKKIQADRMLETLERLYPGIRESIEVIELGSPATFERFTGNTDGAFYGFENTKDKYGEAKLPVTTYLKNLYQTGHWGKPGGGVWNVMANGYVTAKTILSAHS
jgi:phytoene dehydrogenase-like protein